MRSPGRTVIQIGLAEAARRPGSQAGSQRHPLKPMHHGCFPTRPQPQHLRRRCPVAATLAADTAFSHVLDEGIAAAPWRPWSDHCGLRAISFLVA